MSSMRDLEPAESDVLDTSEAGGLAVRGGALRVVAFGITAAVSLVGVAVVARYLAPDRFGQYQTIISLMIVAGALSDLGMATLGTREYAQRSGEDRADYMKALFGLRIVLTILSVAGVLLFSLAAGYSPALLIGAVFASVALLLTVVQTMFAIPLGVELRLGTLAGMDVARQVLTTAAVVGVVIAGGGVAVLLAVAVPVQIVLVLWTWFLVRGRIPALPSWSPTAWRALIVSSIGFAVTMASGAIYQNLAQILTSLVAGEEQTGLFSAAFRVFMIAGAVPFLLVGSAFPILARAARDDHQRLGYALNRLTQVSLIVGGAGAMVVFLCAGPIIDIVGGSSFEASVPVLRILAGALFLGFAIICWGYGLLSRHLHRQLFLTTAVAIAVMGALVVVLASTDLGARGTAIGLGLGEVCLAVGYAIGLRSVDGPLQLLSAESFRAISALGLALGAGLLVPLGSAIAATALALVIYAVALVILRAIPAEASDLLPQAVRDRVPRWMFAD
jgi:O-antigen/teichoic acid export membrane protein